MSVDLSDWPKVSKYHILRVSPEYMPGGMWHLFTGDHLVYEDRDTVTFHEVYRSLKKAERKAGG